MPNGNTKSKSPVVSKALKAWGQAQAKYASLPPWFRKGVRATQGIPFMAASELIGEEGNILPGQLEDELLNEARFKESAQRYWGGTEDELVRQIAGKDIPRMRTLNGMPFESVRRKQILHSAQGGRDVNELLLPQGGGLYKWYSGGRNPLDLTTEETGPYISSIAGMRGDANPNDPRYEEQFGPLDPGYGNMARDRAWLIRKALAQNYRIR